MTFQHFHHTNAWGRKSDLVVKKYGMLRVVWATEGQPRIIIWTELVDLESSMLYTKIQPQSFLGSGEDF